MKASPWLQPTRGMSLTQKWIIAAMALSVIPMLIVGFIGFTLGKRGITNHTERHLQSVVALKQEQVANWLAFEQTLLESHVYPNGSTDLVERVLSSSADAPTRQAALEDFESIVRPLVEGNSSVHAVTLMDERGLVRYSTDDSLDGESAAGHAHFEAARRGLFAGQISGHGSSPKEHHLAIAKPVRGAAGGVVTAWVDEESLVDLLSPDPGMGSASGIYVLGPGGMVVSVRGMQGVSGGLFKSLSQAVSNDGGIIAVEGTDVVSAAGPVSTAPWTLVATLPAADAFRGIVQIQRLMLIAIALVGFASVMIAWRLSRSITQPLRGLVEGARGLGAGDLGTRIAVKSNDEVGKLGASFNRMAEDLSRLYSEVDRERKILAAIQDSMTEGLAVIAPDRRVLYWNHAAEVACGIMGDEITGQDIGDALRRKAANLREPGSVHLVLSALDAARQSPASVELVTEQPEARSLLLTAFPIQLSGGTRMTGLLIRDITQERELEQRRDTFVSVASHEVRTPLTAVLGFVELVIDRNPPEQTRREWLSRALTEGQRLSAIVDDMLNVSRIQSGKITLNPTPFPVEEVIRNALTGFEHAGDRHQLVVAIPKDLPEVFADQEKLAQVLINLVSNAIKYSPAGGDVVISARDDRGNNRVVLSVRDRGIGIAPADQGRLFSTFTRIARPETEGVHGTGLGLYIVKRLVELMQGEIWLESEIDKGSTFHVSLPTGPAAVASTVASHSNGRQGA